MNDKKDDPPTEGESQIGLAPDNIESIALVLSAGVNGSVADNQPVLSFFRKVGFGNLDDPVYLTLDLAAEGRSSNSKPVNGSSRYRQPRGADHV